MMPEECEEYARERSVQLADVGYVCCKVGIVGGLRS